jgi:quercetin dioxygenase-like cupin family protein
VHDNPSVGGHAHDRTDIYWPRRPDPFEDLPLPAEESHNVAVQGTNLVFRCFPADHSSDWHTAPRRQYIFILVGQMEIAIGDGTTRRFGPGDVVLADDLAGQGHTTRSVGVPRISATVPVGA